MKILIVEDDAEMRDLLGHLLQADGFEVVGVANTVDALSAVVLDEPALVLLDVALGNEDGRDVLREIRCMSDVPVVFLTGRGLEIDRIAGLKMGADDYIVKPFSAGELTARIESVLRRSRRQSDLEGGNVAPVPTRLTIEPLTREVRAHGIPIDLTAKEFDLLTFLASSPRQVFSRQQLLQQVWNSSSEWQDEGTVSSTSGAVRRKIESDPDRPEWIVTVRRRSSYRFERRVGAAALGARPLIPLVLRRSRSPWTAAASSALGLNGFAR